jgi:Fur family ferric uptake transcriptional regulator
MSDNQAYELAKTLLKASGNRTTPARIQILSMLLASDNALSHQDIEHSLQENSQQCDRVTVYRTLDWLVTHKIAHKVISNDRTWRYNAQASAPSRHAHFHCKQCTQILCLEHLQPALLCELPEGYELERAELNLQGYCPVCSQDAQHSTQKS